MAERRISPGLRLTLEFGPIVAFVLTYLLFQSRTFTIAGQPYSGLIAITALFIPLFVAATAALWALTGRIARIQIVATVLLVVLGTLSLVLNDPVALKMKPTIIYGLLAGFLGIGLLLGKTWLKYVIGEVIPLAPEGWRKLTIRMIGLFVASALANELVWRTQSERFWVIFETLVMPLVIVAFFIGQTGLFITYARMGKGKKKNNRKRG